MEVNIRPVIDSDVGIFFEHQRDPASVEMAAFPARTLDAHAAHWKKIRSNDDARLRTVLVDDVVAGNIVCWDGADGRMIGYWLGREFWGRGAATRALQLFLLEERTRPLFAHVARHNAGSRRVLEKCGFRIVGAAGVLQGLSGDPIPEYVLRLDAPPEGLQPRS